MGAKTQTGDLDSVLHLSTAYWLTSQAMPALEVVRKIFTSSSEPMQGPMGVGVLDTTARPAFTLP